MKYPNIREEELKNKVAKDYFWNYDTTKIVGDIDFCVCINQSNNELFEKKSLLWAEAKRGSPNVYHSIVQAILTIGKARTFDKFFPPQFLGAFDSEKILFIQYSEIQDIFYLNDFNWNVAPSNHESREFLLILNQIQQAIPEKSLLFNYIKDDFELKKFIKLNFVESKRGIHKIRIDKNNFMIVYNKWLNAVKPKIAVDWELVKRSGIINGDFYLADLLSSDNETLQEKLYVLLKQNHYELDRKIDTLGFFNFSTTSFTDKQKSHQQFWNIYERPPKADYWDYFIKRRDLLVPQYFRERKGSFYTPPIWVEKSQEYLADALGEDWQEEYYIWDCAAGTGNLLNGLTEKYNIWASTLDKQDVDVMKQRIETMNENSLKKEGANLLESHVFQFDFLNDDFSKLPSGLQEIINDIEKRKRLVIYINPPYAEASSYGEESIPQVANQTRVFSDYRNLVGAEAMSELYAQFFIRIYREIPDSIIATFCTPKYITSDKFKKFRNIFQATFRKGFICEASTFDNVESEFPIGFFIWDLFKKSQIAEISTSIYLKNRNFTTAHKNGSKKFYVTPLNKSIAEWRKTFYNFTELPIGYMIIVGPSIQSNNNTFFNNKPAQTYTNKGMVANICKSNLVEMMVYLAARQSIKKMWFNNSDSFLYPDNTWRKDNIFINDCLAYAVFHAKNKVSSKVGINHWIPFTEKEVAAKDNFESNFMSDFIKGKERTFGGSVDFGQVEMFEVSEPQIKYDEGSHCSANRQFSIEATAVFDAGRELWKYYHSKPNININASLYDINEYFKGRNSITNRVNNNSSDEKYNELIKNLRNSLALLAEKIVPKVYEYGFLKN